MKVGPQSYRGIVFVCLEDLPPGQKILLESSPDYPERIKILIDNRTRNNCIQYKEYEQWYHAVYKRSVAPAERITRQPVNWLPPSLVFKKA